MGVGLLVEVCRVSGLRLACHRILPFLYVTAWQSFCNSFGFASQILDLCLFAFFPGVWFSVCLTLQAWCSFSPTLGLRVEFGAGQCLPPGICCAFDLLVFFCFSLVKRFSKNLPTERCYSISNLSFDFLANSFHRFFA